MKRLYAAVLVAMAIGCGSGDDGATPTSPSATTAASASADKFSAGKSPQPKVAPLTTRAGSSLALSQDGKALWLADEDRAALFELALPLKKNAPKPLSLPGRPGQMLTLPDRVLVTIREPGLLLSIGDERKQVSLPSDAWGLAITRDRNTAIVSSAWTRKVTAVDLTTMKQRWSIDVAREPRAIAIPAGGDHAYISHLMGSALTRIDGISTTAPNAKRVPLAVLPSRAPRGKPLHASFGMTALLSPDDSRLFVARHAPGALGGFRSDSWFGASTVDVLVTADDTALAKPRASNNLTRVSDNPAINSEHGWDYVATMVIDGKEGTLPLTREMPFVQPRAMVYRKKTRTLLVASQGSDRLVEIDALAVEPALHRIKNYHLGSGYAREQRVAKRGGAPSAIALSADEDTAYVWCRSTHDVMAVDLVAISEHANNSQPAMMSLGEDPLLDGVDRNDPKRPFRAAAAIGRRMFYNALDRGISDGMACNGCHAEGRDDGHTWFDVKTHKAPDAHHILLGSRAFLAHHAQPAPEGSHLSGWSWGRNEMHDPQPRQTPMLAGRLAGGGRFGWRGQNDGVVERIKEGFNMHGWSGRWEDVTGSPEGRARALAAFALKGLVAPRKIDRELTADEKRGKALFSDDKVGCAACHLPEDAYTNRAATKTKLFDQSFKTPSLLFVGGTEPYYHDGSAPTLDALVANNNDRMGNTNQLSSADRAALVAFMRTL